MTSLPAGRAEVRRDLLWAAVGAAVLFTVALGARDLWNPNEPVYGRAVFEMAERGDWLTPTVNDEIFDEKPILYFWLARAAARLLGGVDELALRLPLALTGVLSVVLVYLLVHPYAGRLRARLAAALLATTQLVFWTSRSIQMDLLVCCACLAALLLITRVIDHGVDRRLGWSLAGVAAGLGFLAKGPVGLVLPGLVALIYLLGSGRFRRLRPGPLLLGVAAFLIVAAPWYVALWLTGHAEFVAETLIRQNFTRYVSAWDHQAPWWYFLVYFWVDMAPWSFFLPLAVALPDRDRSERRLDLLAWVWILAPLVFFSLSASKRSAYLLPVAPAVAILVSGVAERWIVGGLGRARRRGGFLVFGFVGLLSLVAAAFVQFYALPEYPLIGRAGQATALLLLAGGVAMLSSLLGRATARLAAPSALLALFVSVYLLAGVWVLPAADVYKSARPFCEQVGDRVSPDSPLSIYRDWKWRANYSYYIRRSIPRITSREELLSYWRRSEEVFLIVERQHLEEVRSILGPVDPVTSRPVGSKQVYLFSSR